MTKRKGQQLSETMTTNGTAVDSATEHAQEREAAKGKRERKPKSPASIGADLRALAAKYRPAAEKLEAEAAELHAKYQDTIARAAEARKHVDQIDRMLADTPALPLEQADTPEPVTVDAGAVA